MEKKRISILEQKERELHWCFLNAKENLKNDFTDENCKSFCKIFLKQCKVKEELSKLKLEMFREKNE